MKIRTVCVLITLVLLPARTTVAQTSGSPAQSLDTRIRAEITPFSGHVSLFARNLDTGVEYSFNGDERVPTASTIKIAVMIEAVARVAEGRAKWTDELVLTKAARYGGSGIFSGLRDGVPLLPRSSRRPMMLLS